MGNFMKAYTIAFEKRDGAQVASRSVVSFFKRIESILKETPENVIRRINGKIMRVHAYEWNPMNEDYLVIPIGKLKEKNKPFGSDPETQKLIDIPQEMFDVNSLAYHRRYNIALLSSNLAGPNENDVEDYFNSYLNQDAEYRIRLRPIMRNIALEKIRNAEQARSLTISLNVGRSLNDFISEQVHEEMGVREHLKALAEYSKNTLESNTFTLTLGLGRKKRATLDIGALIDLLESINLDASCINEIAVNYRNHPDEKIDIAKLKDSTAALKVYFPIQGNQLGVEYILNNMDEVLRNDRQKYYAQVEEHFVNAVDIGEEYEIIAVREELPVT